MLKVRQVQQQSRPLFRLGVNRMLELGPTVHWSQVGPVSVLSVLGRPLPRSESPILLLRLCHLAKQVELPDRALLAG
jgi:hypothetical protein